MDRGGGDFSGGRAGVQCRGKTMAAYFGVKGPVKSVMEWRHAVEEDGKTPGDLLGHGHMRMDLFPDGNLQSMHIYDGEKKRVHREEYIQTGPHTWSYKKFGPAGEQTESGVRKMKRERVEIVETSTNKEGRVTQRMQAGPKKCSSVFTPQEDVRVAMEWLKNEKGELSSLSVSTRYKEHETLVKLSMKGWQLDAQGNNLRVLQTAVDGKGETVILVREITYYTDAKKDGE